MEYQKFKSKKGDWIDGPILLTPNIFFDERGYFYESWNSKTFEKIIGKEIKFLQDNHSESFEGVIRGLHYQISPKPQAKLVRCTKGRIYDVAVDLRRNKSTFKEWIGVELDSSKKQQLWIPEGFAHGFFTISDTSEVQYKTTNLWSTECERSIIWNDLDIDIKWPINSKKKINPITSEKDNKAITLKEAISAGDIFI